MTANFIEIDRYRTVVPININDSVPENSLARFVVGTVERLDTSAIEGTYKKGGSRPYAPKIMLSLLFYCYIMGIFSSRAIERATYELIPVIYITGGLHPDHDTVNTFRKRFISEFKDIFVQILRFSHDDGILKVNDVSGDGTKIHANAGKHKSMSWHYACELEKRLNTEVDLLLNESESDKWNKDDGIDIDYEVELRRKKLKLISEVRQEITERADERYAREKQQYEEKMNSRKEKEEKTGKKTGGKPPSPPIPGPRDKDQVNFTDGESRIMKVSGGAFEQAYNAQATVDMDSMVIVGNHVTVNPNDKKEVVPALNELSRLRGSIGLPGRICFDNGFWSPDNMAAAEAFGVDPYIACGREAHNVFLKERFSNPEKLPEPEKVTPLQTMKYRLQTEEGKKFYARRKSTVEPVFGIIKEIMGFRQFMLRGLEAVTGEWNLVCIAFNLKRLHVLAPP